MAVPNTTHENVNFPGDGSQYSSKKQDTLNKGDYFIDDQGRYWEYKYTTTTSWYSDVAGLGIEAYYGWELRDDPKDIDRLVNKPGHTLIENQSSAEFQKAEEESENRLSNLIAELYFASSKINMSKDDLSGPFIKIQ